MGTAASTLLLLFTLPQVVVNLDPKQPRQPKTAEAALEAFEKDKDSPEPQRIRGVRALGTWEGPKVTEALLDTLRGAKTFDLKVAAAQALAEKRRDNTLPVFVELLDTSDDYRMRNAAATGIGRHGDEGVALLEARLPALDQKKPDPQAWSKRTPLLAGLAAAATERAADVLAKIASDAADPARDDALRRLATMPDTPAVKKARESGLTAPSVQIAADALKQLDARGWPGTKDAALALCKRMPQKPIAAAVTVLVDVLAKHLEATTYEPFLAQAAAVEGDLESRHAEALKTARGNAAFVAWLASQGVAGKDSAPRVAAVRILAKADQEPAKKALLSHVRDSDADVAAAAIAALGARGDKSAATALREATRSGPEANRAEALLALHKLAGPTPEWRAELGGLLGSPSAPLRTAALDLLAELRAEELLPQAHKALEDKVWTVRAAACGFCRAVRSLGSIPVLIARIEKEQGRMKEDVLDALEDLTALRFNDGPRWLRWWDESKATFALVPPKAEREAGKKKAGAAAPSTVTSYYDLPLASTCATFVVDTSGSMSARIGTGSSTRLEEAKRQLERTLQAMPEASRFNLIFFNTAVQEQEKRATPADKAHKESALTAVKKLTPGGGTNIYDALERAYADPAIDTIYLLTDGGPSAGKIQDPEAIVAEVEHWTRTRKIKIHAISVGDDSKMMKRLAAVTGGEYRYVR